MFEKNASYLYVGNAASTAADGAAINTIAVGSVAFCTEDGKVEKQAASSGKYRIAQKLASGQMIYSPFFDMALIKNKVGKSYAAPVQQISYLGYNGTSGALDATANADYVMHLEWSNTAGIYNNSPLLISSAYHTSTTSQYELALGLKQSLDAVLKRQAFAFAKCEIVSNGTFADWTGVASHMKVVKGSTAVVYTNGSNVAANGEVLANGTLVFIAGATYKVYGTGTVDGFQLDSPYVGDSAEVAGGTTYATNSGLATSVTSYGLKFTGIENSAFDAVNDTYSLTSFKVLPSLGFVTATVTYATKPNIGSGYWKLIANKEIYSQFLDKAPFISAYPRNNYRQETSSAKTYDVMTFEISEPVSTGINGVTYSKQFSLQIATDVALNGDDVDTVLGLTV